MKRVDDILILLGKRNWGLDVDVVEGVALLLLYIWGRQISHNPSLHELSKLLYGTT